MDPTPDTVGEILGWVFAVQAVLYAVSRFIECFMHRTQSDMDNKVHWFLSRLLTLVDAVTGNREHKLSNKGANDAGISK